MPVYNGAATLERAARSILEQTMDDLELIIVDDGSSDGTREIALGIDDPRVRYIPHDVNRGLPNALNTGVREAAAPVVAIQDDDDWSAPQRLERLLAVLDARPEVAVVGSRMPELDAEGRSLTSRAAFMAGDLNDRLMRFNPISNPSTAFRRDVVLGAGGYDPRYRLAPEYDLWLRLGEGAVVTALDEPLAYRTMGNDNISILHERDIIWESVVMRVRALRRRRSLHGAWWLVAPLVSYATPLGVKRWVRRRLGQPP
jgi:glycosyltransferase involved in cell wall biosynthesis